jgi:hypothetical protein
VGPGFQRSAQEGGGVIASDAGTLQQPAVARFSLATLARFAGISVAVMMLFTALANWGWNAGRIPAPPLAFVGLVVASAGTATLLGGIRGYSMSLLGWTAASAVTAMAAFLWSSGSEVALQETQTRILSAALFASLGVLLSEQSVRMLARRMILVATIVAVAINTWEVTHPMTFSAVLGRSAGLYVNPNIAGAAIIAGMLIGLPAVSPRLREGFSLIAGIGVLATLSRGALLCWLLSMLALVILRALRAPRLAMLSGAGAVVGLSLAAALLASGRLGYLSVGAEQFVRRRLMIGSSEGFQADVSASSRSQLAMHALEMFGERPLAGHGTGATVEWREPESTHNIYARQLAEYGVLGGWLAPAILLIGWRASRRCNDAKRNEAIEPVARASHVFMLFVATWGLFSHNVLDDAFILVGLAIVIGDGHSASMIDEGAT